MMAMNTSTNLAEAIFAQLIPGFTIDDIAADVSAGAHDTRGQSDWEQPAGLSTSTPLSMPPNSTSSPGFAAAPGSWVVICIDVRDLHAAIAPVVVHIN